MADAARAADPTIRSYGGRGVEFHQVAAIDTPMVPVGVLPECGLVHPTPGTLFWSIRLSLHMRRHTHLVQLRLTHDEVRGLDRLCRQDMRTRSNLIRLLIAQEVARRQGLKSPGV